MPRGPRGTDYRASRPPMPDGAKVVYYYTPELADRICDYLAAGYSWHRICNTDDLPSYSCLHKWMAQRPEFAEAVHQAREVAADLKADLALEVAEESTHATVQSDRLRVSTLKWHAAKHAPHRYGAAAERADRLPSQVTVRVLDFERYVDADGETKIRAIAPPDPSAEAG